MAHLKPVGIKKPKGSSDEMTVPEFAMPPDAVPGIAQVIVDIWRSARPRQDHWTVPIPDQKRDGHGKMQSHKPQRQSMQRHRNQFEAVA